MPGRPARGSSWVRSLFAILLAVAGVMAVVCAAPGPKRSAVLFIGDGMGPAYVTVTRVARGGSGGRLRMDALPYTALSRTHSSDSPVTDSAAAASAMACGQKTANGILCEDASAVYGKTDGRKLESIAVWAKKRGLRVGLVTTTTITHATPAAFYAQEKDRENEAGIARQTAGCGFDLLLGGGRKYFPDDVRAEAQAAGFTIVETAEAMRGMGGLDRRILGLFADGYLPYQPEIEAARARPAGEAAGEPGAAGAVGGGGGEPVGDPAAGTAPTLVEMTRFAIDALRRTGQPFFLMVEGGRIDHAGHANWARTLVDETAAFDEAIGYAVDTLDPKSTLVLVTADHETGGLALNGYPDEKDGIWSTYGDPSGGKEDEPYPVVTFSSGPGTKKQTHWPPHGADDPRPSGLPLGSAAHTGVDVPLYAWGAGADRVHGTVENTTIYTILREHLEGKPPGR
ncbi:MAG TPA: alkaline phosphatase [Candidatus Polarisedimenticolia bacterium]|nr:alkaline phosphatase [Candidatus Polarisedimenticolia bacterium]